jgi:hypothetical protein
VLWFTVSELSKHNDTNAGPLLKVLGGVFDSAEAFPVRSFNKTTIPMPLATRVAGVDVTRFCRAARFQDMLKLGGLRGLEENTIEKIIRQKEIGRQVILRTC